MKDEITNLEQENEKLSKEIKKIKKEDNEIRVKNSFLVNGFHDLEERIDKAIEYIKNTSFFNKSHYDFKNDLLNILTGGDDNDERR